MKTFLKCMFIAAFYSFSCFVIHAQTVNGLVQDASSGNVIPFANIIEVGTTNGVSSDLEGKFSLELTTTPASLRVSYIGYDYITIEIPDNLKANEFLTVTLKPKATGLDEVLLVGSRLKPRTAIESAVPIDNISVKELTRTGQTSIDQMLNYKVPSYNASSQTVSDATAHFDPADLRGIGPSRTLVLINGKRKNYSSLLYINDTPGKGEVGVDMKSIPASAIERIEVLRDGASAQYGSDAIAGVINIVLKKDVEFTTISTLAGVTSEGDGFNIKTDVNTSVKLFGDGYLNVTAAYLSQEHTDRSGKPGKDDLFGIGPDNEWILENPNLGMTVGMPDMVQNDIFFNAGVPLKGGAEIYSFGGVTYRQGKSFALYRPPYWVPDPHDIFGEGDDYNGFQPTFETSIFDNTLAVGVKGKSRDWNYDISTIHGSNTVDYLIGSTINTSLEEESGTRFKAGGYEFNQMVNNLDISRQFGKLSLAIGSEFRVENFVAIAGEEGSYAGSGIQSFPGLQPRNEADEDRHNIGIYTELEYDVDENLLIGGALRFENYSDFGENISSKISARYKLMDEKLTIRGSASTGFRAPSLHQIYFSNIQTLVSGGTVSNQGTFNNNDPAIQKLGVPQLDAETSENFTVGLAMKPIPEVYVTVDYYNISIDDRVLFTNEIGFDADEENTNEVEAILEANSITSLKFFINAVNTESQGIDIVVSTTKMEIGTGKGSANVAFNWNDTEIKGEIAIPEILEDAGYEIFNRKEQARILTARPNTKVVLGLNYEIDDFNISLSGTYFGEVTWQHASDPDKDQTFEGKFITDLSLGYQFNDWMRGNIIIKNLLDVYPDEIETKGDVITDLGGRFKYPWEVNQFGFNGMMIAGGLTFEL